VILAGPLMASAAFAGQSSTAPAVGSIPVAVAQRVAEAPALDGDVLNDHVWSAAVPLTAFWQTAPDEGEPASEQTEVRIVYTADALYIGVVCYDRDPASIVVSESRRDASLGDTDSFRVLLDTFLDHQTGYVFGTSPSGQQYDGQVVNEGTGGAGFRSGGATGGAGGGFNLNWDGAWDVRTRVSGVGWSAEFAIPFRTLRYAARPSQTWGVNFERGIRRRNETAYWAPLPRQFNLVRVSLAGQLSGIEMPATSSRNLKFVPYVVGETVRRDSGARRTTMLGDLGADLKYSLTSSLALDLTVNTDFAQVEVDEQQINLDRFTLFFPEKRPFFLENAGMFTVGNEGGAVQGDPAQTELFFSRRIGLGPRGEEIPILGGGRLSGKVSNSVSVGLLNMQTDATPDTPANNFTAARVRRDLANRSSIGGVFVNRQATGGRARANDHNRTYGVDGRWGIGQNGLIAGFLAHTQTPERKGKDYAYNLAGDYTSATWRFIGGYMESGENFNPEVGFQRRRGFRKVDAGVWYTYRPENFLKIQQIEPHVTFNTFWNFDGFQETSLIHIDNVWEFDDSSSLVTTWNISSEGVRRAFPIQPGVIVPVGDYDHSQVVLSYNSNGAAPIGFGMRGTMGGRFGGDEFTWGPSIRIRSGDTFRASLSWNRTEIDLPVGSFVTNLIRSRISYDFSPQLFVQSLVQYNDSADLWSVNFRFGWVQQANTGLFIVYNDTRGLNDTVLPGGGRSLILKFSRMIDVLE
jgi:hypothetical protein